MLEAIPPGDQHREPAIFPLRIAAQVIEVWVGAQVLGDALHVFAGFEVATAGDLIQLHRVHGNASPLGLPTQCPDLEMGQAGDGLDDLIVGERTAALVPGQEADQ